MQGRKLADIFLGGGGVVKGSEFPTHTRSILILYEGLNFNSFFINEIL